MKKEEIKKSKISEIAPYLRVVARAHNLNLSNLRDFKEASRILLSSAS